MPVPEQETFPGTTASVPAARAFVRRVLGEWQLDLLVDAAVLVVSELATNAVLHARSGFTVRLELDAQSTLRVEVLDASAALPAPRSFSVGATTGRGLAIIEDLVSAWGVERVDGGKAVWVELLVDAGGRSSPRPPGGSSTRRRPARRRRSDPAGPLGLAA
ncbi:MAG: ATP-binding protein [Mycobacteriales bacterium]